MDNGIRIDGQPIDEIEDHRYNLGIGPESLVKSIKTNNSGKLSLASYMREKADWMRKRAEPFDRLAELLENNEDLVNYIVGYVEGKCSLPK